MQELPWFTAGRVQWGIPHKSSWYGLKLEGTYIKSDAPKLPDPFFVSRVVKIQKIIVQ